MGCYQNVVIFDPRILCVSAGFKAIQCASSRWSKRVHHWLSSSAGGVCITMCGTLLTSVPSVPGREREPIGKQMVAKLFPIWFMEAQFEL